MNHKLLKTRNPFIIFGFGRESDDQNVDIARQRTEEVKMRKSISVSLGDSLLLKIRFISKIIISSLASLENAAQIVRVQQIATNLRYSYSIKCK